jgi:8-hydroxy-5-deazaflavin:NADPH oxidoreductase
MRVGFLGSGLMGGKLGTIFAKAGHHVVFSCARSQRKLSGLAREAGRRAVAGTPREAAEDADVPPLAVHWTRVSDVLKQAGDLSRKVLITCSLPMNPSDTALVIAHTSSGAEALAKKTKRARVVSAVGTVPSEVLFDLFAARRRTRRRPSLLYCGNDNDAKSVVQTWIVCARARAADDTITSAAAMIRRTRHRASGWWPAFWMTTRIFFAAASSVVWAV